MEVKYLYFTLRGLGALLHVVAFYFLWSTRYDVKYNRIQRYHLLNLCVVETVVCVGGFLRIALIGHASENALFYVTSVLYVPVCCKFYATYLMLTFDRFLIAYLLYRYSSVMTLQRARITYYCLYVLFVVIAIVTLLIHPVNMGVLFETVLTVIWVPLDTLFVFTAIFTYLFIAVSTRKRRKQLRRFKISRHCFGSGSAAMLPTMLIISSLFCGSGLYYCLLQTF